MLGFLKYSNPNSKKSGAIFHNYEGFFSFQLLAVCDSKYNSIFANNDCSLLSNSTIEYAIEQNTLNIPEPNVIECTEDETSYFLLRNEIFLLNTWLMRPYPGLLPWVEWLRIIANPGHHLLIENAFGIFTMRWWIFQRAISECWKYSILCADFVIPLSLFATN